MKLFQIEEPDGSPVDPDAPGVAIGIDIGGTHAEVAVAVGGNAALLADRDGFALDLAVPSPAAPDEAWQLLFEGARLRAERALAQPVTHAVVAAGSAPDAATAARLSRASEAAGLALLRIVARRKIGTGKPVLDAAILAEDLAPRPQAP
jgi:molecular chaperone DnaK (HSP70)